MRQNIGICKGGPMAGRQLADKRDYFAVASKPKFGLAAGPSKIASLATAKVCYYVWQGHGVWLWTGDDNGGHRQAPPAAPSNPVDPANPRDTIRAIDPILAYSWPPKPSHPPVEDAGIRAGEIIGERMWLVRDEGLSSLTHKCIWPIGGVVTGDLRQVFETWWDPVQEMWRYLWGGVYAYSPKGRDRLDKEWWLLGDPTTLRTAHGIVRGKVALWGEVIEHEHGYRAENAKIVEITDFLVSDKIGHEVVHRYKGSLKLVRHIQSHLTPPTSGREGTA